MCFLKNMHYPWERNISHDLYVQLDVIFIASKLASEKCGRFLFLFIKVFTIIIVPLDSL